MSAQMIRFPKPMKRGAKVRVGPCAQIIAFPSKLASETDRLLRWGREFAAKEGREFDEASAREFLARHFAHQQISGTP